ncbi:hypothetical protein [Burkholderia contaminans]|uniref:hypothetical protein n=1 Tax=Burkholderia contaminans TaxID=488447 RepID=UPI000F55FBE6|nr:hypothetical protein [Burkholderia contaminans]RQT27082.1 hypothetical protein DF036_30540 [Burkholderia contaminans]
MSTFDVLPYSIENLVACFAAASRETRKEAIEAKRHRVYFEEYFRELAAATIVVERDYIDRDYLGDYASYYDRCFKSYQRRTTRLHFFTTQFDRSQFESVLRAQDGPVNRDHLAESYLGFIVVKPLPQTIIGRTCLSTYPPDNGRRQFPSLRTYHVHLYGLELKVRSLAYQEQDTVVAACATSALWSCFQGTGMLFQHVIPPPVEITKWAGDHLPENLLLASARPFPNAGLTLTQMAHAVKQVGLEPFVVKASTRYGLNGAMYGYLRGKIPSILVVSLVSELATPTEQFMGAHAIALTGFSLENVPAVPYGETGFLLRASRIGRVYGHDDQVGPFARMVWERRHSPVDPANGIAEQPIDTLKTSWSGDICANPTNILLPLYHKIRIPFIDIHDAMLALDAGLEGLRPQLAGLNRAEWDIFLTTSDEYKASVSEDYAHLDVDIMPSLLADLPRFVWRVIGRVDELLRLDFLFDATGVAHDDLLVHAVAAKTGYSQLLAVLALVAAALPDEISRPQVRAILKKFSYSPIPQQPGQAGAPS